nr:uncharacterized protein LOC128697552 [Cherax quadricarinatus]XP_053645299.1 uncharacterized protein LOC128697552 [Cherax quadricarinatus]XP_053645300.1 uncharacterized protein LOC128697552 [Cherax quadricarinatus]XP_053645301.1 uncharacterized protein LOC128697552 [Cherax quadricarinatus]XP_053645302.1 uncharacterized protein LOC128697552 [Cherax quadricarinatus]
MKKTQDAANKKPTSNTPTYAAIAKIQATTTKLLQASTQSASTIITPPTCDVTKIHYCLLYAHIQNMAVPGSFNSTINELFALNNIPAFIFPASPPSEEILKFTKDLINTSTPAAPTPPTTSDVTPTTSNEKFPSSPLLKETDQSEAFPPETSSHLSIEDEDENVHSPALTIPSQDPRFDTVPDEDDDKYTDWGRVSFCTTVNYPQDMEPDELKSHLINKTVKYVVGHSKEDSPIELSRLIEHAENLSQDPRYQHLLTRLMIIPLQRFKHLKNGTRLAKDAFFIKKRHNSK